MDVHIATVSWDKHAEALREIRHEVFVVEQEIPSSEEYDEADADATHFLALNEAGQRLGCARLLDTGQIGRMAVIKAERGTGLGMRLLEAAIEEAKAQGMARVFLHAQKYAEPFYRKAGFVVHGAEFSEVGIPHVSMEMMLPLPFDPPDLPDLPASEEPPAPVRENIEDRESREIDFSDVDAARKALVELVEQSSRRLLIFSPLLDHDVFADPGVVEAISSLARSSGYVEVQILLQSSKLVVDRGHPLLELTRRLDEAMNIRLLDEPITDETSSFVCADNNSYWLLPSYLQYRGMQDRYNPVLAARMRETFKQAWEKSIEDPELRVLRL